MLHETIFNYAHNLLVIDSESGHFSFDHHHMIRKVVHSYLNAHTDLQV